MTGRIIKGIGGFYYVYTEKGLYTCKAKGLFRKDKVKPLVGDYVEIEVNPREEMTANIVNIFKRSNEIVRPNVSNIDQALIIFALKSPEPNFVTLDKMILQYKLEGLPVVICFNKQDLVDEEYINGILEDYSESGCKVLMTSVLRQDGIEELRKALEGKTSAVAGPSGAGKSSLVNALLSEELMETGIISRKLERGKHTTRHSEIVPINDNTFIMDTPGFSSFELYGITADRLGDYYDEFEDYLECRFTPCSHTHEPGCLVKEAVSDGKLSQRRYENYCYLYNALASRKLY